MDQHSIITARLRAIAKDNSNTSATLGNYLLANLHRLPILTIETMAQDTNTSIPTVNRFFRKIGIRGIKELRQLLFVSQPEENRIEKIENLFSADSQEDFSQLAMRICNFYTDAIHTCSQKLSAEIIQQIAELLSGASAVFFAGLGTSSISAQYAYIKFFRIKSSCVYDKDIIISKMKAATMGPSSVLFAISSSGRTKQILEIARIAKANGATVISLSDFAGSPLSKLADISLSTSVRDSNKYIDTDFPMIQAQITIIDILYAGMYQYLHTNAQIDFQKTAHAVKPDKDQSQ